MRVNDALLGSALVVGAVLVLVHVQSFPNTPGQQFGPKHFPSVIALGLLGCGLKLGYDGLKERRATGAPWIDAPPWMRTQAAILNMAAVVAAILTYIALAPVLGFLPTSILVMTGLAIKLGGRVWTSLVIAVAVSAFIHVAFYTWLRVPLPLGLMQAVLYR